MPEMRAAPTQARLGLLPGLFIGFVSVPLFAWLVSGLFMRLS